MLLRQLCAAGPVLADGGWATELQKRGLAPGAPADPWNLLHPGRVAAVAEAYLDAGSRVILTNTFRANRAAMAGDLAGINRAGAAIARHAANGRAHVFGSIGPTGRRLGGDIRPADASAAFAEQADALAQGGAQALLLETFTDPEEASLALAAARRAGVPVIVSFSFHAGLDPASAARRMADEGADAVGANCGAGIDGALELCRRLRAAVSLPLWIKPSAGMPRIEDGLPVYPISPDEFARHVPALVEAGANFLGGCCGASPDFIRAMGAFLHAI